MNDRLLKRMILEAIQDTLNEEDEEKLRDRHLQLKAKLKKLNQQVDKALKLDPNSSQFQKIYDQIYKVEAQIETVFARMEKKGPLPKEHSVDRFGWKEYADESEMSDEEFFNR